MKNISNARIQTTAYILRLSKMQSVIVCTIFRTIKHIYIYLFSVLLLILISMFSQFCISI